MNPLADRREAKLRRVVTTRVDLCKRGANQEARIALFKNEDALTKPQEPIQLNLTSTTGNVATYTSNNTNGPWQLTYPGTAGTGTTFYPTIYVKTDGTPTATKEVDMPEDDKKVDTTATTVTATEDDKKEPSADDNTEPTAAEKELQEKITQLEEQLQGAQKELATVGKTEEVMKSLPEPIAKQWEEMSKRAEEAESIAKAERDKRLDREYTDQVRVYKNLSVEPDKFGPVLRKIEEVAPDEAKEVRRILDAAEESIAKSALFKSFGSDAVIDSDAENQLETLAKSLAKEKSITLAEAEAEVLKTEEGARLYSQYLNETRAVR